MALEGGWVATVLVCLAMVVVLSLWPCPTVLVRHTHDAMGDEEARRTLTYLRLWARTTVAPALPSSVSRRRLLERLRTCVFSEVESPHEGWTVDKGRAILLRVREPDGAVRPLTTLQPILVHELAHVISISEGHTSEFHVAHALVQEAAGLT